MTLFYFATRARGDYENSESTTVCKHRDNIVSLKFCSVKLFYLCSELNDLNDRYNHAQFLKLITVLSKFSN